MLGLIKGLLALHRNGICHGDLKPANLVVTRGNRLVMIDFGSAWSEPLPPRLRDRGTLGYAAPEQWLQERLVDGRADQFSVSAICYQLLTGELPWDGLGGSVVAECAGQIPPITLPSQHPTVQKRHVELPPALDAVLERGLAVDKDHRFDTTEAWVRAFEDARFDRGPQREHALIARAVTQLFERLFARGRSR